LVYDRYLCAKGKFNATHGGAARHQERSLRREEQTELIPAAIKRTCLSFVAVRLVALARPLPVVPFNFVSFVKTFVLNSGVSAGSAQRPG
jgi:hypothetical protein